MHARYTRPRFLRAASLRPPLPGPGVWLGHACLVMGLTAWLGAGWAHAQDGTATQPVVVVLSPMAQAALYRPSTPSSSPLASRLAPRYCMPGDFFPMSRDECIRHGLFTVVVGTVFLITSIRILRIDLDDELLDAVRDTFAIPLLILASAGIVSGTIMVIRGSRMPPGPARKPQPRPF